MNAFLVSAAIVAVAEIGDKTQLLALLLAVRFRRPVPIILGILFATIANHGLAAWAGVAVADWLGHDMLRWVLGVSFLLMAGWMMVPDRIDHERGVRLSERFGPFLVTLASFFLVEIGDKTQVATIALAARFDDLLMVTLGTTCGMMATNIPAVLVGDIAARKLPMRLLHAIAAALFAVLGLLALSEAGSSLMMSAAGH